MEIIDTQEAAKRLGVTKARVLQLIRAQRLPATLIGNSYAINTKDLARVVDRKTGRPKKGTK